MGAAAAADLGWSRGRGEGGEGGEAGEGEPQLICCAFAARAERVNRTRNKSPVMHDACQDNQIRFWSFRDETRLILKRIHNKVVLICVLFFLHVIINL